MNAPKIQALGVTQQGSPTRWKATGYAVVCRVEMPMKGRSPWNLPCSITSRN
jgi:hypothetical protein